jgi:hypothetical protein
MKPQGTMKEYVKAVIQARKPRGACLDEEQVMAFYSSQLRETEIEAIRDHLAECPTCLELAREARQFLQAMSEPIQVGTDLSLYSHAPWHRVHWRKLFLLAASVVIAVSVALLLWRGWPVEAPAERQAETPSPSSSTTPEPRENPWRDLEIVKAEYTPAVAPSDELIWRDEGASGSPRLRPFARAMRPYERNDFAEAERRLARFLEKNPTHAEAHFYRGVSLLLLGRATDAIAPLEATVGHGHGRVVEEAHWYLALAYLKAGEPSKALKPLDAVVATSGRHRAEAEKLRRQVVNQ